MLLLTAPNERRLPCRNTLGWQGTGQQEAGTVGGSSGVTSRVGLSLVLWATWEVGILKNYVGLRKKRSPLLGIWEPLAVGNVCTYPRSVRAPEGSSWGGCLANCPQRGNENFHHDANWVKRALVKYYSTATFCVRFLSLTTVFSRLIHVVVCISISFFFMA